MSQSLNSPVRVKGVDTRTKCVNYRLGGLTYREIAEKVGISEKRAWELVRSEMERARTELSESALDLLEMELERLRKLLASHWISATRGKDLKAATLCLKVIDQMCRLVGLYPAAKLKV